LPQKEVLFHQPELTLNNKFRARGKLLHDGKMKKYLIVGLLTGLLFTLSSCNAAKASMTSAGRTPVTEATPTHQTAGSPVGPSAAPTSLPDLSQVFRLASSCNLLDSRDLASLYSTAEVMQTTPHINPVNHVEFSTESASAREVSCTYYVFHKPGSKQSQMLQVNYWVDVPARINQAAWAKVWADASSKAPQTIPGIGDGAFYKKGSLTFEKGGLFMTIQVVDTQLNLNTRVGMDQQIALEKQIALDALGRMG
jgi:hypothetical protein